MENERYKSILDIAPFGYSHHKIVLDESNAPIDYIFLEVNAEFEKLTGLISSEIINKPALRILPDITRDSFNSIEFFGEVALKGGEKEFEHYSEPLKRWYRVKVSSYERLYFTMIFTDITQEKLVSSTLSQFIGCVNTEPEYQVICDNLLKITNAEFIFLNILDPLSNDYTTVTHSKINIGIEDIEEILGFEIKGKKWRNNSAKEKINNDKLITRFNCLKDVVGEVIPNDILSKIERLFITGEVAVINLVKGDELLGNLTIIMPEGKTLINEPLVEIYARQVGQLLAHCNADKILEQFFTVNLDLLCIADLDCNFIKVNHVWTEILGYSLEDIMQRKFLDFVHPEDLQATLYAFSTLKQQKKVINYVNRYQTKSGQYRQIEWRSSRHGNLIFAAARDVTERIDAEHKLRISEEKFRSLVSQSLEMLYLHDHRGKLLEVNKEAVHKTGYSKDELLGMSVFDLHPDKSKKDKIIAEWNNWTLGNSHTVEVFHQRKDGGVFPVEISTGKILIGDQVFILALGRDITERKNYEIELKTRETRFRSLFEQTNDAVFILDLEGRHVVANNRAAEMLGYSPEEIQNISFKETSAEPESSSNVLKKLMQGEKIPIYERAFKRKDGQVIYCEVNVELVCDADGKPMHIQSVLHDITQRKNAEEVLLKTKEWLEQTSQMARVGGWEKGLEIGEDKWSETTKAIHEVPEDFVPNIENAIGFYKEGESREKIVNAVNKLIETGQTYDLELQIVTAKGREKWIRTIGNAEFRDGKCVRIFGVFQDIDDRKKIELALLESQEKLKELNATKDKFFSIIAHDLKGVFNGILGFAQLLTSKSTQQDIKKVEKYSNRLFSGATSGFSLLENLLDWSRVQTGRIKFIPSLVSLNDTIQRILEISQLNLEEKNIKLTVLIADHQKVFADPLMLGTILRNLISNAIKFTDSGGSITIKASEAHGGVLISIRDTGLGISDDIIPQLFRIDANITSKGTKNERGTGLGLILCKEFVEMHGGKIWAESKLGIGSTFSFILPNKRGLE